MGGSDERNRFDRYEILRVLGHGGMGEVLEARAQGPHGFQKIVAIKRIHPARTKRPSAAERFIREATLAAQLQHGNIVQVFDFGRVGDELFIVMECIDGSSLDGILTEVREGRASISLGQTLQIVSEIARALEYAHRLENPATGKIGVIHRDISPGNILVSRDGTVKLTDFGIAAWADPTSNTDASGKPAYMSPEQLRGEPLSAAADLYSTGVVLYELLTLARPWRLAAPLGRGITLEDSEYLAPSELASDIPRELDDLCAALLDLDPERRLSSAEHLLQRILSISYGRRIVLNSLSLKGIIPDRKTAVSEGAAGLLLVSRRDQEGLTVLSTIARPENAVDAGPTGGRFSKLLFALSTVVALGVAIFLIPVFKSEDGDAPLATAVEPRSPIAFGENRARQDPAVDASTSEAKVLTVETARSETSTPVQQERESLRQPVSDRTPNRRPHESAPITQVQSGLLNVYSEPWSEIWIDGQRSPYNAPRFGIPLADGVHEVRLFCPSLGLSETRVVTVQSQGPPTQIRISFRSPDEGEGITP